MIWQKQVVTSYAGTSFGTAKAKCSVKSSMHNHCTHCDGADTPETMANAAFEAGISDFGFSCHSKTLYPPYVGIGSDNLDPYFADVFSLKQQYRGKMRIYLGIEQDYYAPVAFRKKLDYIIGAVHDIYDKNSGKYYWVDGDTNTLKTCINDMFEGDGMALCRHFYELTAENAIKYKPDIIAHFDLVVKNNEGSVFFDEESALYKKYALESLNECIKTGAVFELNTGGIFRNYRRTPYPSMFLLKELCKKDVRVTISSDSHCTAAIGFMVQQAKEILREAGFKYYFEYINGEFTGKIL